jgi:hypothetical protein
MHLLIPFASARSAEVVQRLPGLSLPNLARLLARLRAGRRDEADEYTLSPPHERALATLWRWHGDDGALPFAAHAAAADGVEVGTRAWGLISPAHWHVGREHISMADPDALGLDEAGSRALFEAVRELFEGAGYVFAWGAPSRWYAAHPGFVDLPCASLDRVIGRNVDLWLGAGAGPHSHANAIRRLQSEVQLLLYPHAINDAREARRELPVNSFWVSGCGVRQPVDAVVCSVDLRLRRPVLDGDADAWTRAWSELDAGPLAQALKKAEAGETLQLTLCGERNWQRYESAPQSFWQRWRAAAQAPAVAAVLEAL